MNAEKLTQKALETIQTAQSMAQENGNQYLTPEHLLYALLDQDGGLIGTLFTRMGVDVDTTLAELDTVISRLPKVSGAAVVCEGGGDPVVRAFVVETLSALLGIKSNHISVMPM